MKPQITVGLATYNDWEGVWATVQSIYLHNNWLDKNQVEIVIVDTSPNGSEHKRLVQNLVANHVPHIKYVEMSNVIGTTYPRDIIFQIATAKYVVVMDCHVMLPSNALTQLNDWLYDTESKDLIHGPMYYDSLNDPVTHFSDQFRGGMWGTWATMWKLNGTYFICEGEEVSDENKPKRLSTGKVSYLDPWTLLPITLPLPEMDWAGHQTKLKQLGCTLPGNSNSGTPFPIPGMGMGLFASDREAWLGFAKNCSGFGGEEMNIHTKYRQAERQALCLPFLKWNHRFGRVGGAPYPLTQKAKVRNYVLWANELNNPTMKYAGTDKPATLLERIHTHFVAGGLFSVEEWAELIADPINYPVHLTPNNSPPGMKALDALFFEIANKPRDLDKHAESIRNLVYQTQSVTAFVKRGEWEPILASGYPKTLEVYQSEISPLTQRTHEAVKAQPVKDSRQIFTYNTHHQGVDPLTAEPIKQTDMLALDKLMRGDYVYSVLKKHGQSVDKFILIRGTQSFGEAAEGDPTAPGLYTAIKQFIADHPEWFVHKHKTDQYGYTVLAKHPIPFPEKPIRPWPLNYGPGTELKAILSSVGINPSPNCSCRARMIQMDEWGIEGCKEHFDTIVGWLVEKAEEWGWNKVATTKAADHPTLSLGEKLSIGWKSLTTGLAFKVNWTNPYPDLVRESIERAKKNETKQN